LGGLVVPSIVEGADPFMVVALPDTQNYSQSYPATFTAQTQWVVDNAATENIQFVTHLGDIVQNWNDLGEWSNAKTSMNILDAGGMPYGTVMGNHDGRSTYATNYLNNFGPQHYSGESWYGGASPSGLSNYEIISAGGMTFLFLHVQIDTPQVELDWAQGILDQHHDKPVVFSTHRYLQDFRVMQGRYTRYDYPGFDDYYEPNWIMSEDLFQAFLKTNKNIFMVLCGHCGGQYHQVSQNDWDLPVYEILQDFDSFAPNGGDGWMRLLTFDTDANQIDVDMYSPTLGRFRGDGPKETHEDFQGTLWIIENHPEVVAAISFFLEREDPNVDPDAYFLWLMENDGQNLWNVSYADGQRDSSFTISVDFEAYLDYKLTIGYVNPSWGHVELAPEPNDANLPEYPARSTVTLTAVPNGGKAFTQWRIYDPNYPGDGNYAVVDANDSITIVMDANREVTAVFKCGSGVGIGPPLSLIGLGVCGLVFRSARRRR